jgi:predicted DCC family thiol-disulfide oxidoreductase YuxK
MEKHPPLVLFDGVCNLCHGAVRFVIARDPRARFEFASLQSEVARERLRAAGAPDPLPDSIVLVDEAGVHVRSTAALRIARRLAFPWPIAAVAYALPRALRDALYDVVARSRYRWFGRRESCALPTPELAARFLDAPELSRARHAAPERASTDATTGATGPVAALVRSSSGAAGLAAGSAPTASAAQATPSAPEPAGRVAAALLRLLVLYTVLYALPFPLGAVPGTEGFAAGYESGKQALVSAFAASVLDLELTVFPAGSGDTTYNYVELLVYALAAVVGAGAWTALVRARALAARTLDTWRTYLRLALGAVMLSYGWVKVFPLQFGAIGPDDVFVTYGDSSPMGLLWRFMAASQAYTAFAGLGEVLGGLLLMWRRTQLAGALVTIGVMANVVALNFCYDVPVKLFSSHLLLSATIVAAPDLPRLAAFLFLRLPLEPRHELPCPLRSRAARTAAGLAKLAFVVCVAIVPAFTSYAALHEYGPLVPRTDLHGTYRVLEFGRDGLVGVAVPDDQRWIAVGWNDQGVFAAQLASGTQARRGGTFDAQAGTLTLRRSGDGEPDVLAVETLPDGRVRLRGELGGAAVEALLERLPDDAHLLTSRGFRWINEFPFNR